MKFGVRSVYANVYANRAFGVSGARHGGLSDWRSLVDVLTRASLLSVAAVILLIVAFDIGTARQALARDNGQWSGQPPTIRQWFQSLMQPDHPRMSCCGEADAVEADQFEVEGDHYIAVVTDGKGIVPSGTRFSVPNQKMKFDAGNPTGHGILFIGTQGQIYCYVAPGGV